MEYSDDGGETWKPCTDNQNVEDQQGETLLVRIAATDDSFKSDPTTVLIPVRGEAPVLTIDNAAERMDSTAAMEYFKDNGTSWIPCLDNMDLSELTNATLLVRYACDGTKPASNNATVIVPSRNAAPAADLDRAAELLTVSGTAPEYRTENGWTAIPAAGLDVSSFYGKELAVREKYDAEHFASLPVLVKVPEKGAKPDLTIDRDKQTVNTTAGMEYSTDGGKTWTKCDPDMDVSHLTGQTILVREAATEDKFASEPTELRIPSRTENPVVELDTITETVNTTTDMDYSMDSGLTWNPCNKPMDVSNLTGQTIIIRNHGDSNSFPSGGVTVSIPARREAPKVEVDSKAQTVSSDKGVEFSADGGKTWAALEKPLDTADYLGKTILFRFPATKEDFAGRTVTVVISNHPGAPVLVFDPNGETLRERLFSKRMDYVRRTYIPKSNGKMRPLGICSIWDKLVEKCIQLVLEPYCETKFVPSSFGFRERVSTHNALAKVKNECQTKPYVLSIDMKDYFGTIDPDITYRELWHIGVKDQVILNYIYHFIKKGYFENSCKVEDPKGSPQGSILGPLVSNVYLHRFDVWLRDQGDCWHDPTVKKFHDPGNRRRRMEETNLKIGIHVRYADDILVLCKDLEDAERFRHSVTKYLTKNMKLVINEEKTKIYDLTRERMKYLGYDFYVFKRNTKHPKKKGRFMVANTLPKNRANEIVAKCRELLQQIRKHPQYDTFHEWNAYVVGIHNYYCGMNLFCESFNQLGWRIKKLFYHTMEKTAKFTYEQSCKNNYLQGKYSSWGKNGYYCFEGFPIIEIGWASYDKGLIAAVKGTVKRDNPYHYGEKKHRPGVSMEMITYLVNTSKYIKNSRLAMFRISKYSSMKGISYLSGEFVPVDEYHCHHIIPRYKGGSNDFDNLCVLSELEHRILHSSTPEQLYVLFPKKKKRIKMLIDAL